MDLEKYTKYWDTCIERNIEPFAYEQLVDGAYHICVTCHLQIKNDEVGKANIAGEMAHVKCANEFLSRF